MFPGQVQVRRVGPRTARAFELSFQQTGSSLVFWMQEPAPAEGAEGAAAADERLWQEVHAALGNPGEAFPLATAAAATPPAATGAEASTPAAPGPPPRGAPLEKALRVSPALGDNASAPEGGAGGDPQLAAALLAGVMVGRAERGPSLAEVLRPDALLPLLDNAEVQEQVRPYLPEEHRGAEHITRLATSPQFREQLEVFSRALQSGQLDLQQFGLEAAGFSAAEFLQGIERMVAKQEEEQGGGGNQPEDSMDQD